MGPNNFILTEIPRFRQGVMIDSIISNLEEKLHSINNISRHNSEEYFKNYIDWFSDIEQNLNNKVFDRALTDLILDANYRQVLTSFPGQSEVIKKNLINDDIRRKRKLLDDIVSDFKQIKKILQGTRCNSDQKLDSRPIIVDTNLLMHFHPINDIELLDQEESVKIKRFIVPREVVRELDKLKFQLTNKKQEKCVTALKWIKGQVALSKQNKSISEAQFVVELNTLSFADLVPDTADEVILRLGNLFKSSNIDFLIATADTGLALLAEMEGYNVKFIPQN
jgi:rRNA-processing protein FCF1